MLLLSLLRLPTAAAGDEWGLDRLESSTPASAQSVLGDAQVENSTDEGLWERIGRSAFEYFVRAMRPALSASFLMLTVVLLCSLCEAADGSGRAGQYVMLAGVAAIGTTGLADVNSYMTTAASTLQELSDYTRVLLPTLSAVSAAAGSVSAAAGKCAATALFMDLLMSAAQGVVMPLICGFAALSLGSAAFGDAALNAAAGLMRRLCTLTLTALCTAFTLWLSLISIVSGSADAALTRAAKTGLAAIPVVGRVISDAAAALSAAAAGIRGMAGVFGLAVTLLICLAPLAELTARYVLFKLTAALCGCVAEGRFAALLNAVGSCYGMLLALCGAGAAIVFVSLFSLMRAVL